MKSSRERLPPVGEVRAAEDVEDDADGDPDPEEDERKLEHREQRVPEGEGGGEQHDLPFLSAGPRCVAF